MLFFINHLIVGIIFIQYQKIRYQIDTFESDVGQNLQFNYYNLLILVFNL